MDNSTIISVASVLVASAALIVAVYQSYLNRVHNKLSVKPLITDSLRTDDKKYELCYKIQNNGLGTAVIKSFAYFWEGKEITADELRKLIKSYLTDNDYDDIGELGKGSALAKDESKKLISFHAIADVLSDTPAERYTKLKEDLYLYFRVKVQYESLYEVKFQFETNTSTIESELKLLEAK